MNKKMLISAIVLGAVLIVLLCTVLFLVPYLQQKQYEDSLITTTASTTPAPENLGDRDEQDVVSVKVEREDETFTFTRSEYLADWVLEGQETLVLDQSMINSLASNAAAGLVLQDLKTDMSDLAQFGLEPARATITVTFKDGESQTYYLGDMISNGTSCYGYRDGVERLVLMPSNFYMYANYPLYTYALPKDFVVDALSAKTLYIEKNGEVALQAEHVGIGTMSVGSYMITEPYQVQAVTEFDSFVSKFGSITLSGMVDVNNKNLDKYGLDKPAYAVGITYDSEAIAGTGDFKMHIGDKTANGEDYFVYFEGEDGVYTVPAAALEFVETLNPFSLVNRQFMLYSIAYVDTIDVTTPNDKAHLQIIQPPADADQAARPTYKLDGKDINRIAGVTWYQNIISVYGYGALPEGYDASGEAELTIAIKYLPGNPVAENLFEFIPYEKDYYAVRVDGTAQFYCRSENVELVINNLAALRAGELDGKE